MINREKIKYRCILAMLCIMAVDVMGHCFAAHREKLRTEEEQREQYRDIEPLVHYAGAVLGGYVFLPDKDDWLSVYDQSYYLNAEKQAIDRSKVAGTAGETAEQLIADIHVRQFAHDGQRGWVWVELWQKYYPDGPAAGYLDLWFIKKDGLKWNVEYIDGGVSGRRWLWRERKDDEEFY